VLLALIQKLFLPQYLTPHLWSYPQCRRVCPWLNPIEGRFFHLHKVSNVSIFNVGVGTNSPHWSNGGVFNGGLLNYGVCLNVGGFYLSFTKMVNSILKDRLPLKGGLTNLCKSVSGEDAWLTQFWHKFPFVLVLA